MIEHKHNWSTVFEDGELECQECDCGAGREVVWDFQDGTTQVTYYPPKDEDE